MINNNDGAVPKPVWKKSSPAIPVRENMKTSYLQLSGMHGDHLPRLKKIERPEYSTKVRHYENLCQTAMMKNVNIMYKDHKHMMRRLARTQESAFKTMCRVHREKRKVQRAECIRRQDEFREKMKSHRMRTLLLNVVVKFRENVRRKKHQRALAKEKEEKRERESIEEESLKTKSSENVKTKISDGNPDSQVSEMKSVSAPNNSNEERKSKQIHSHKNEMEFKERKGSLTRDERSIKPEVKTAENRERWDPSFEKPKDEELNVAMKKSRAMEVSKSVSKPVTRTKGFDDREKSFQSEPKQEEVKSRENSTSNATPIETADNANEQSVENPPMRPKRASLFVDEFSPDYGWFTVGNPMMPGQPPSSTNVWNHGHSIKEEPMDAGSDSEHEALPPLRTRKPGIARPPSSYLRDQLDLYKSRNSSASSASLEMKSPEYSFGHNHDHKICHLDLRRSSNVHGSLSERMTSSASDLPILEVARQNMSASCEPVRTPQRTNMKYFNGSRSVLIPVNSKLRSTKKQSNKDKQMSANMMWVLREEDKSRKKWRKFMTDDDEKIVKYHKNKDGQFIPTVTSKRELFLPPSNKEHHRQQKLLVGEKVKAFDRRERIDEFYKTIILPGETPNMFLYDMPPPEPPKRQQRRRGPAYKFGNMYDAFKDKDMVNPLNADSYEAMKGVSYLRVREDDEQKQQISADSE